MEEKMIDLQKVSPENIKIIGAELKRRRVTNSKTLINSSSVCSVSYLSKIENGKIISKFHILSDLCEEQGIAQEELITLLKVDSLIEKMIEALFWKDNETIKRIYNEIYLFENYKVNLMKAIYEMIYFHWQNVESLLNSIYVIKDNIEEKDEYLYYYLLMCLENYKYNYSEVYLKYLKFNYCKNPYLLALVDREKFIAVAKYGFENPIYAYEQCSKKYYALFNYNTKEMYELLIETLATLRVKLEDKLIRELKPEIKLKYLLAINEYEDLEELLKTYNPTPFEKLLISTAKNDYATGEKIYKKLQLHKLSASEVMIANYCNLINKGDDEELANYLIQVAIPYVLEQNNGVLFKMFLKKLSTLAFEVGRYKAVAAMNLTYFEMEEKCKLCMF